MVVVVFGLYGLAVAVAVEVMISIGNG